MLRIGSLFSGIGGIELGLSRVKKQDGNPAFEVAWQVELEPYCQRVLEKHWPDVRRWDDIKTFPPGPIDEWSVDMVTGGFPCPTVSYAGSRKGSQDDRWLWPEMRRVLQLCKPRFCLVENVGGLLSAADVRGVRGGLLGGILRDLAQIGYGAGDGWLEYHCVPAEACGARHKRDRIWIIGKLADAIGERGRGRDDQRQDAVHADARRQVVGTPVDCGGWSVECRLGRADHGLPEGLDECRGWECGVPRVATGQRDRIARLKALGNAVVPQVVQFIGEQIVVREEARAEG